MPKSKPRDVVPVTKLGAALNEFIDSAWYRSRYPDVASAGIEPLDHYINYGAAEARDPNPWFDGAWYTQHYPDVQESGMNPLIHYLTRGAAEGRNPHPQFNAAWYVSQHPEAADNPVLYQLRFGQMRGWPTEKPLHIADYLPSLSAPAKAPAGVTVDVVIPVYRGLAQTRRCLNSVFADTDRPAGRIIVIDDQSPEPPLVAWLQTLADDGRITLLHNERNLGFGASVNFGMEAAGNHDVVLLNNDTEVPRGWLLRLAAQAYKAQRTASVSPFSNNATICSYPSINGGELASGITLAALDEACKQANSGRSVDVPTTVGFCMYIRRAALAEVGPFDAATFGRGYGEENDFCMRSAIRQWRNIICCDVFVYHEGSVSFGPEAEYLALQGLRLLAQRYPQYRHIVAQHVQLDPAAPCRFAITAALFRQSTLPVVLMVSHDIGGGVKRHVSELIHRLVGRAHCLLLTATANGAKLSVPLLGGHPEVIFPSTMIDDLAQLLKSAAVSRVHIHHLLGMVLDVRDLIYRLGVPFDITVHDYFSLCPQTNFLPSPDGYYCGEPGPRYCNVCVAERPAHAATDILSWRWEHSWQFIEADRVICPSSDVRNRVLRYWHPKHSVVALHEPVDPGPWPMNVRVPVGRKLRVAVLGVLAGHKGRHIVQALAELADRDRLELHLVGYVEDASDDLAGEIRVTGQYNDEDLPALLERVRPHVIWFPASWPETYSYTLSTAIDTGLPIVASRIGAFTERLQGRPLSWLIDPGASTEIWLAAFETVRAVLAERKHATQSPLRSRSVDFYAKGYLSTPKPRPRGNSIDLRRDGRISIVVIPERLDDGGLSPRAHIRLLLPLDHPDINRDFNIALTDAAGALRYRADIVVTQRHAVPNIAAATALVEHCRWTGAKLVYDVDDDLLHVPRSHPNATALRSKATVVEYMADNAFSTWVSTPILARRIAAPQRNIQWVPNGLDERLWLGVPMTEQALFGPVRILCIGTGTHDRDFAVIAAALERLHNTFRERISIDVLGATTQRDWPKWFNRPTLPVYATSSYPGFVSWITQQPAWHIGLAPLLATRFNDSKSAIKTLSYAALGLTILASDVIGYRGSIADGTGGMLVPSDASAWYDKLRRLVQDGALRRELAAGSRSAFVEHTLKAQARCRRDAWVSLITDGRVFDTGVPPK